jgi:hypothetical protein
MIESARITLGGMKNLNDESAQTILGGIKENSQSSKVPIQSWGYKKIQRIQNYEHKKKANAMVLKIK